MQRNTIQKDLVFNAVCQMKNHPTAEQVYNYIKERFPAIGKSTVYRNLNLLCESGKLIKISLPNFPEHVDATVYAHHHAVCKCCGKVIDVDAAQVDLLKNVSPYEKDFELERADLLYYGICAECKQKN